jgi:hypothetical protein
VVDNLRRKLSLAGESWGWRRAFGHAAQGRRPLKTPTRTLEAVVVLRRAILKQLIIRVHVKQIRASKAISCRRLSEDGPGQMGRCVDVVRSRGFERERRW